MAPQLEDRTRFIMLMNKNLHQLWMVETFNPINNWTMIGDCRILSINRHQVFCSLHPCDGLSAPGMFQAMQNGQKGPLKAATSQSFSKIPTCYPQPLRKLACHQKREHFNRKCSSSNHWFVMCLIFGGVLKMDLYQVRPICYSTGRSRKDRTWILSLDTSTVELQLANAKSLVPINWLESLLGSFVVFTEEKHFDWLSATWSEMETHKSHQKLESFSQRKNCNKTTCHKNQSFPLALQAHHLPVFLSFFPFFISKYSPEN